MVSLVPIRNHLAEEPIALNACYEFIQLQREQLDHDEQYHREIARLTIKDRLTHLTLHFAKYVGYLANRSVGNSAAPSLERVLLDSFIIALSMANTLNIRVSDHLGTEVCSRYSMCELSKYFATQMKLGSKDNTATLLAYLGISTGRLAKACEGLDHIESLDYRGELVSSVTDIIKVTLAVAAKLELDLATSTRQRLAEVKSRHMFHRS